MKRRRGDNMRSKWLIAVIVCLTTGSSGEAKWMIPSFNFDNCVWEATHILVVTEGEQIDGIVEVLEVWKGDSKAGDELWLPELALFAVESKRKVRTLFDDPARVPPLVTCARMVLFLRKETYTTFDGRHRVVKWKPADLDFERSTAWIEQGKGFALRQWMDVDRLVMGPIRLSEQQMKQQARKLLALRERFDKAIALTRPVERARAFYELALVPEDKSQTEAIHSLGQCSPKDALPLLRGLLCEESVADQYRRVALTIVDMPDEQAGPLLARCLRQELPFWRQAAESLPTISTGGPVPGELKIRGQRLAALLLSLGQNPVRECHHDVMELLALMPAGVQHRSDRPWLWQCPSYCETILTPKTADQMRELRNERLDR